MSLAGSRLPWVLHTLKLSNILVVSRYLSSFPTRRPNVKVTYTSRRAASAATDRQTPHASQKSDAGARSQQQPVRRQEQENMGAININVNAGSDSEAVKGEEMKQKEPKEECERTPAK